MPRLRWSTISDLCEHFTSFESAVAEVLDALRPGEVITYGEVAAEAGYPGAHRAVGRFLRDHGGYHWWRVVNSAGRLAPRNDPTATPGISKAPTAARRASLQERCGCDLAYRWARAVG